MFTSNSQVTFEIAANYFDSGTLKKLPEYNGRSTDHLQKFKRTIPYPPINQKWTVYVGRAHYSGLMMKHVLYNQ